jgi:hypothetical protein
VSKEPDGGDDQHENEQRNDRAARAAAQVGGAARFDVNDLARHFLSFL